MTAMLAYDRRVDDLRALARAALLAFADLGVFLPSNRDRLICKMRFLGPLRPEELLDFVNRCIDAGLITTAGGGRVCLDRNEANRLAHSMDGHTPVPDDQARAWALRLGSPTAA